ncbi:MAG TPA: response regulator [Candidatus Paceibacterota bacterium]|nr:response regulator [Candidatus Paceibacterota bacterium]
MPAEKYSNKILIVEDEEVMLKTLTDNLTQAGFGHLLQAKNGEEGLIVALKENPDLILLDIVMPIMDGITMLKKLREDPRGKNTKVILLTNLSADDKITNSVITNEPSYYLVKADYSIDDVVEKAKITLGVV